MNDEHRGTVQQTIEYMKGHLDEPMTTQQLADLAGYSPFHFSRVFKRVTGISVRQYLSALRVESGKSELLKRPSLLVKIGMNIGLSSPGTFNTRFKQFVGLSPKRFRSTSESLHQYVNQYENKPLHWTEEEQNVLPRIHCQIEAPETFRGMIYVGLFPRPVPDQKPITGTAVNLRNRSCILTRIPAGTYYVLAAGIPWSLNPRDYFLLNKSLRGKLDTPVHIEETTELSVKITLREPLPFDPPIVVNLPLLLFEKDRNDSAK
ncbi:AraC family transcriptional regulator [Paenibacillus sp. JCM 10914]|uniref:AraC family transcriptional regulator n=1 Tax=Paenibacillus sp. JCM 10914 TaxID=1236974 RepID=UPI0003CC5963|nr:AraC family transcriptional regulator [Paenibacillus sp. JCM 10914]GAE05649.1 probable transcriptional regulator [Paenibacillus sp. JCM 10914]